SMFFNRRVQITTLAARHVLPAIYNAYDYAEAGGLMSYGTSLPEAFRQTGVYAGRIIKGEKPADLPVVQSAKFVFAIKLPTARSRPQRSPDIARPRRRGDRMKRRAFITLLGGVAAAWPLAARGQQAGMRRVGMYMRLSGSDPVIKGYLAAFAEGLAPLGWSQGRNLQLVLRFSGDDASANAAAADLVRQNPEVILSHGTEHRE